jgi:membrane protein
MRKTPANIFHSMVDSLGYYLKGTFKRFMTDDIILYGSAIAFNAIMCLIPILLLLTSLVGMFLNSSTQTFQRINELLNTAFPDQPYANRIKVSIQGIVYGIMNHRKSYGWISIMLLIWTATFLFNAVRNVLNRIFKITRRKLFFIRTLENVLSVVAIVTLFLAANVFFWLSSVLRSLAQSVPELDDFLSHGILHSFPILITFILAILMFYIVYQLIPDQRIPVKSAIVATLTTTVLWVFSAKAFQLYLEKVAQFHELYGTYTFLLVFLLWIEYSSVIYIIGAIVGQLHREREAALTDYFGEHE